MHGLFSWRIRYLLGSYWGSATNTKHFWEHLGTLLHQPNFLMQFFWSPCLLKKHNSKWGQLRSFFAQRHFRHLKGGFLSFSTSRKINELLKTLHLAAVAYPKETWQRGTARKLLNGKLAAANGARLRFFSQHEKKTAKTWTRMAQNNCQLENTNTVISVLLCK